ncbi:MAG: hybrid sensor histidine kinase/response regulator [Herbaspirillum sp.]|nr:hybrid sensor histidine kinase/response regulator [Herbaspirillum sp.]
MNGKSFSADDNLTDAQRFQLVVSSISDYAIYMLDLSGKISSWNAGAQRFKGYTAAEILGRHFSCFYTPEDQAAGFPAKTLRTVIEEGKYEGEGWRVRKDGTRFWASIVVDPIRDESGALIGFAKITRDITDRKMAQAALEASERQFQLLVQSVTDYAIYMLDTAGIVTNWNSGAARIKGYTANEVIGTHFSRFYAREDRLNGLPERALAAAAAEGRCENEGWRLRKDGTRFWAHVVIDAIRNDLGRLIGFAKVTRDITEKREAEEALQKVNAALFQSQKMEALGQLTGGVAHDFNNLLAVVSSGIDVIIVQNPTRSELKVLESMRRAIDRGATLTQQLLSFSRRQPLKIEKYNLNDLVRGFEPVLRRAGNTSIAFDVHLDAEVSPVMIDSARFETSLLNLVVNARDAMPSGGILSIQSQNIWLRDADVGNLPAGAYVKVAVVDNGTGMPPEVAARAFEPFFTTKEVGKGTGLGLSQVYGFIKQSGGDIAIDSQAGKGTSINMYLPVVEQEGSSVRVAAAESETVLIVEDQKDLLDVAAELFRALGYDTLTANNGTEAIEVLERAGRVDILFSDVVMPNGINGLELARLTRERYPDIKIILASGYPLPALKTQNDSVDNFTFLNKPYQLSELAKKLRM